MYNQLSKNFKYDQQSGIWIIDCQKTGNLKSIKNIRSIYKVILVYKASQLTQLVYFKIKMNITVIKLFTWSNSSLNFHFNHYIIPKNSEKIYDIYDLLYIHDSMEFGFLIGPCKVCGQLIMNLLTSRDQCRFLGTRRLILIYYHFDQELILKCFLSKSEFKPMSWLVDFN